MGHARTYLAAANETLFLPRGLHCRVLKTAEMLAVVGASELALPPLEVDGSATAAGLREDPSMRRVRALGGRVAALVTEGLPVSKTPEGFWKKAGAKEAKRRDGKVCREILEERERTAGVVYRGQRDVEERVGEKSFWVVVERVGR